MKDVSRQRTNTGKGGWVMGVYAMQGGVVV